VHIHAGPVTLVKLLEEVLKQREIGILCFPVRGKQVQSKTTSRHVITKFVQIGSPPWTEFGPDLAYVCLTLNQWRR
jgi:hypothetical protein